MPVHRLATRASTPDAETVAAVRGAAAALPGIDDPAFAAAFDRFADSRVVLLGEASHGTSEFYRARAAITRRLIEQHGFTIVAVEADWPDAARIDAFVRQRTLPETDDRPFSRFPTWMWRNAEVQAFTAWLREHNAALPDARRVAFRGLDIYSLRGSIAAVLAYLDEVDPQEAKDARERYACLSPWQADPARYGRAVLMGDKKPCAPALLAQLTGLLDKRVTYAAGGEEDFFDAVQNARIARAAEHYYRLMYQGSAASWNLRDRHMYDTLSRLLELGGSKAKAVVWAHNSHIGNAAATAMGWQGEFNIGELCRKAFEDDAALIGFGTDRGQVAAASDWDEPMEVKTVLPARPDSYEAVFREAGPGASLTNLRDGSRELREILSEPRLERAIGVVYRPETELQSHYFEAVLPEQFDAYIWLEETRAVTPLGTARESGGADLYPFGV